MSNSNQSQIEDNNLNPKILPSIFTEANLLLLEAKQKLDDQKTKEALDILHHLTILYPNFARAYNLLGFIYDSLFEEIKIAEKYYKKCLELDPDFKEAYNNYAYCLLVLKKYNELEEFVLKSINLQIVNKAYLYHLLGKAQEALLKLPEAIQAYETAILHSFDIEDIQAREKDIARCTKKQEFLIKKKTPKKSTRKSLKRAQTKSLASIKNSELKPTDKPK